MSSGGGHGSGLALPLFHELHEWMESTNSSGGFVIPGQVLIALGIASAIVFHLTAPAQSFHNWGLLFALSPLWIPVLIGRFAFFQFVTMKRAWFQFATPMVLLEFKLPREILKSPRAMETVFASLNIASGESTWHKKYWWGRTRQTWSFEIASIGGEIRFFMYIREGMRRATESFFYAQYPQIEIIEAKDYSRLRDPSNGAAYSMFAVEYKEGNAAPYPIKTYVDYGLDKPSLKVEEQVNPFAQVLEVFGSLGPGEELWYQMIIRVAGDEKYRGKMGKKYSWKDEAKNIVEEIRQRIVNPVSGIPNPTEVQKEMIAAVERNVGRLAFDVGIRAIYSAPQGQDKGVGGTLISLFKPFNTENYNKIGVMSQWSARFNDYPWEDLGGSRKKKDMYEAMEFYRYRSYFHNPYRAPWMTMSTEELATIYHFPSSIIKTPSLPRISSPTQSAPANLPI